uniref:Putative secreted peptide n=1 Tax=Anopheles braziliensis TaxID=58242 RepID=A0A2M3ZQ12_9DIPT
MAPVVVAVMTIVIVTTPPAAATMIDRVEEAVAAAAEVVREATSAEAVGTVSDCRKPTTSLRSETGQIKRMTVVPLAVVAAAAAGVIWTTGRIDTIAHTTSASRFQCRPVMPVASWINPVAISSWEEAIVVAVADHRTVTDNRCPIDSIMAATEHKGFPAPLLPLFFTVNSLCVSSRLSGASGGIWQRNPATIDPRSTPGDDTFLLLAGKQL